MYTEIMQNPVEDLLINTHEKSLLLEYSLFRRNSFNWLYHIHPGCFNWLRFACTFRTKILSGTFMYIFESSNPYKYAVTTSINYKYRWFCIARGIKYQKCISFITREYVSWKSIPGLCVKSCVTNLALYLITSFFCSSFEWIPTWIQQERFQEVYVSHWWTPFFS
jgi:hypothetical protein